MTRSAGVEVLKVSEKSFQAAVVHLAKVRGWLVYFVHDSRHSPAGWPDLVMIRPPRSLFRELKTEKGKLTDAQLECAQALCDAGLDWATWRPSMWPQIEESLE